MNSDDGEDAFDVFDNDDGVVVESVCQLMDSPRQSSSACSATSPHTSATAAAAENAIMGDVYTVSDPIASETLVNAFQDDSLPMSSRTPSTPCTSTETGNVEASAARAAVGDAPESAPTLSCTPVSSSSLLAKPTQRCTHSSMCANAVEPDPGTDASANDMKDNDTTMANKHRDRQSSHSQTVSATAAAAFTLLTANTPLSASCPTPSPQSQRETCCGIAIRHPTAALAQLPVWMSIRPFVDVREAVCQLRLSSSSSSSSSSSNGVLERTIVGVVLRRGDPKQSNIMKSNDSGGSSSYKSHSAYAVFHVWSMKGIPPCEAEELAFVLCGHAFGALFTQLVCGTVVAIGPLTPMTSSSHAVHKNNHMNSHRSLSNHSSSFSSPMLRLSDSEGVRILGSAAELVACAGYTAHTQTRCAVLVNAAVSPYCARHVSHLRRVALGKHAPAPPRLQQQQQQQALVNALPHTKHRSTRAQAHLPSHGMSNPQLQGSASWSMPAPLSSCGVTRSYSFLTVRGGGGGTLAGAVVSPLASSTFSQRPQQQYTRNLHDLPWPTNAATGPSNRVPNTAVNSLRQDGVDGMMRRIAQSTGSQQQQQQQQQQKQQQLQQQQYGVSHTVLCPSTLVTHRPTYPSARVLGVTGRGSAVLHAAQRADENARDARLFERLDAPPKQKPSLSCCSSAQRDRENDGPSCGRGGARKRCRDDAHPSSSTPTPHKAEQSHRCDALSTTSSQDSGDVSSLVVNCGGQIDSRGMSATDALCEAIKQTYAPLPSPTHLAASTTALTCHRRTASRVPTSHSRSKSALVARVSRALGAERRTNRPAAAAAAAIVPSTTASRPKSALPRSSPEPSSVPSSSSACSTNASSAAGSTTVTSTVASTVALRDIAQGMNSAHDALRREAGVAQVNAYLDKHAAQEKAQEVLQSMTQTPTRAVFCHDCRQWYLRVTESCRQGRHRTECKDTVRCYVRCEHCTYTTFVLGESVQAWRMLPRCPRCGVRTVWERGNALRRAGGAEESVHAEE